MDTYCMEFSIRVMVRKAARLAVYEEMTIKANIHQTPIIILVASVVYGTSPPKKKDRKKERKKKFNKSTVTGQKDKRYHINTHKQLIAAGQKLFKQQSTSWEIMFGLTDHMAEWSGRKCRELNLYAHLERHQKAIFGTSYVERWKWLLF